MKKCILVCLLSFGFIQLSNAQQTIQTNIKASCTLQSGEVQGCVEESITASITLNENKFMATLVVNGVETVYAVESKVYQAPYWKYTISNTQGDMMFLKVHQSIKEFGFYPVNESDGAVVTIYKFN